MLRNTGFRKFGTSRVEQEEQRPLDHYDLVSILYLAQQNRTDQVLSRYVPQEILNEGTPDEQVARFNSQAGDYRVDLLFQRIHNDVPRSIPQRGNVSSSTMHQVVTATVCRPPPGVDGQGTHGQGHHNHPGGDGRGI